MQQQLPKCVSTAIDIKTIKMIREMNIQVLLIQVIKVNEQIGALEKIWKTYQKILINSSGRKVIIMMKIERLRVWLNFVILLIFNINFFQNMFTKIKQSDEFFVILWVEEVFYLKRIINLLLKMLQEDNDGVNLL